MQALGTVPSREKQKAQHEPHWFKLSNGCYLGFRKLTSTSTGTWLARFRDDSGKQQKRSFGDYAELPPSKRLDAAKRAAEEWFAHLGKGGTLETVTVRTACERYVRHVCAERGGKPADDLFMRFRRWVFCHETLAELELAKLNKTRMEQWRHTMTDKPVVINRDKRSVPFTRPRSPASINRDIAALRVALNFAHDAGSVTTDMAWRVALRPTKNADGRRDVYLDREQRKSLIESAPTSLATLLRGLPSVPLRPGALAALNVGSYDPRLCVLKIGKDKAGRDRKIKLPEKTASDFTRLCTDRPKEAPRFQRPDGKAWDKDYWKAPIKEAAKKAELSSTVTAYSLRNSVITDLVTDGLDLLTVAQLSGTSVMMIERHDGHLRADHAAAPLARLVL